MRFGMSLCSEKILKNIVNCLTLNCTTNPSHTPPPKNNVGTILKKIVVFNAFIFMSIFDLQVLSIMSVTQFNLLNCRRSSRESAVQHSVFQQLQKCFSVTSYYCKRLFCLLAVVCVSTFYFYNMVILPRLSNRLFVVKNIFKIIILLEFNNLRNNITSLYLFLIDFF